MRFRAVLFAVAVIASYTASASFTQKLCQDAQCSVDCKTTDFNNNECHPLGNGGGSIKAYCTSAGTSLEENLFLVEDDCSGANITVVVPTQQCLPAIDGGYAYITCFNATVPPSGKADFRLPFARMK